VLARYPDLAGSVEASVLVGRAALNLHLKGGVEVLLPERGSSSADHIGRSRSRQEIAVARHHGGRSAAGRSCHGAAVDDAAAARDEALTAAEKDKKAKDSKSPKSLKSKGADA